MQTVVLLVLARALAPSEFGILAIAALTYNVLQAVNTLGIGDALTYLRDQIEEASRTALTMLLVTGLLLMGATWAVAPQIASFFHSPAATFVLRGFALAIPFDAAAQVPIGRLTRSLSFSRRAVTDTLPSVIGAVVTIAVVVAGYPLIGLVAGQIAGSVTNFAVATFLGPRCLPGWSTMVARRLLRYGAYLSAADVVNLGLLNVDYIIVGHVLGPVALGYYSLAYRICFMPYLSIAVVANGAVFPYYCRLPSTQAQARAAESTISVINALCVVALVKNMSRTGKRRAAALVFGAIWLAGTLGGAAELGFQKVLSGSDKEILLPMEENVRAYVATHDPKYLIGDHPYSDANRLANLLDDPTIRKILPTIVRPALPLEFHQHTGDAFVANGYPAQLTTPPYDRAWGSYSRSGREARGAMESESFQSELAYLQFEVAGSLARGLSLSLVDDETGKEVRVNSKVLLNENWRSAIVSLPGAKVHIIASDDNEKKWFAFREPRELGRFGYYAQHAVSNGRNLLFFGLAISMLSIVNKPVGLFRLSLSRSFDKRRLSQNTFGDHSH